MGVSSFLSRSECICSGVSVGLCVSLSSSSTAGVVFVAVGLSTCEVGVSARVVSMFFPSTLFLSVAIDRMEIVGLGGLAKAGEPEGSLDSWAAIVAVKGSSVVLSSRTEFLLQWPWSEPADPSQSMQGIRSKIISIVVVRGERCKGSCSAGRLSHKLSDREQRERRSNG